MLFSEAFSGAYILRTPVGAAKWYTGSKVIPESFHGAQIRRRWGLYASISPRFPSTCAEYENLAALIGTSVPKAY